MMELLVKKKYMLEILISFSMFFSSFSLGLGEPFLNQSSKSIDHSIENLGTNKIKKSYYIEAYWQVTRSDLKYGRLSQTETHKDTWEIKEVQNLKDFSFVISSTQNSVELVGFVSTIENGLENFDVLMIKEMDLVKLLGIELEREDISKMDTLNPNVVNVYIESSSIKDNNLSFKLPSEDYYDVRLELKM